MADVAAFRASPRSAHMCRPWLRPAGNHRRPQGVAARWWRRSPVESALALPRPRWTGKGTAKPQAAWQRRAARVWLRRRGESARSGSPVESKQVADQKESRLTFFGFRIVARPRNGPLAVGASVEWGVGRPRNGV